jgi:hypothetical protein
MIIGENQENTSNSPEILITYIEKLWKNHLNLNDFLAHGVPSPLSQNRGRGDAGLLPAIEVRDETALQQTKGDLVVR